MPMNLNAREICIILLWLVLICQTSDQWELSQDVLITQPTHWHTLFPQSIFWAQMDRSCSLTGSSSHPHPLYFFCSLSLCVVSSSLLWQFRSAVTCCLQLCCHWSDFSNFPARMLLSKPSRLCLVTAACSSQMFLREIFVSPQPLMWFIWLNNKAEWFSGLSVWSSQFCLHNQYSTMRIFPLVQSRLYFRFLLALPTFHWPHHRVF